jgi:hypothetical protein
MDVKATRVIIERDPMTKTPKTVWPWEVPILRLRYGDEKVEVLGDVIVPYAELPDAQEEYLRLRQVYGIESDTKQSHVDLAYGRGQVGWELLEKAIKAAVKGKDSEARVEAAQHVVDTRENPKAKLDEGVAEARASAHRDPLDDEFADQSNATVVGAAAGGPGDVSGASESGSAAPAASGKPGK